VEYDTYGRAEEHHGRRPAEWWPNYLHKTNLEAEGAPEVGTTHRRTLTGLTAGATYHYRIVVRGPAQAVTPDATFVAGAAPPPSPTPGAATATVPPLATATPTPTAPPIPGACQPRPDISVMSASNGDGRLRVTITAGVNAGTSTNALQSLRFTSLDNAVVEFEALPAATVPSTVVLPTRPSQIVFFVRRLGAGQATTVHLEVTDRCPTPWRTFVGGGPSAF
jgi:hypothetical protein